MLSELDGADQRRFLRFVTGCPRLPPGGLAALQPRLTLLGGTTGSGAPRYTSFTSGKSPIWNQYGHERTGWGLSTYNPAGP